MSTVCGLAILSFTFFTVCCLPLQVPQGTLPSPPLPPPSLRRSLSLPSASSLAPALNTRLLQKDI